MTTDLTVQSSRDVFRDAEWPLFSAADIGRRRSAGEPIGVIEVTARVSTALPGLAIAAARCEAAATAALDGLSEYGYKAWIFVAHGPPQPASQAPRLRRFLAGLPIARLPGVGPISHAVAFESGASVRYAGVLQVGVGAVPAAMETVRVDPASFLVWSKRQGIELEPSIREMFWLAFPSSRGRRCGRVDWASLADGLCCDEDILVRVTGSFDDVEASVDIVVRARAPAQQFLCERVKGFV